jgi:hypothetical protein
MGEPDLRAGLIEALITATQEDHPVARWLVGDLAELDLPARGIVGSFDAVVCAGNVRPFLAPSTRPGVLGRLAAHLRPKGRIAVGFGFGSGRGYEFDDFFSDAQEPRLVPDALLSTWDIRASRWTRSSSSSCCEANRPD